MASYNLVVVVITLAIVFLIQSCSADLSLTHYHKTCPRVLKIVKDVVEKAINDESRMGASLLRLHFHDCFVNGCDASVLLDGTNSEKFAAPNRNSIRGFNVIDKIKSAVEKECPGEVSCADILAIAARDSVVALGGPSWNVNVGRRDSKKAYFKEANNSAIPAPTLNLTNLTSSFETHGLSVQDLVALSGAHTIGQARCTTFRARIYNETNIDESFEDERRDNCSISSSNDNNLAPLDPTPYIFDNGYYSALIHKEGLLHSDQQLFTGVGKNETDNLVRKYSKNKKAFFDDFVKSMIKMSKIGVLTGNNGEIRKKCTARAKN